MTKNPNETLQISGNILNKDEDSNLKYLKRKKKKINSPEKEKNNLYIKKKKKIEENETIKSNEINNTYEIIDIPSKDLLIKKCYEYIIKLNDVERNKIFHLEKILFKEKIKFKLIFCYPYIKFYLNEEPIVIEKKQRIITFIDEKLKKKYKRFIYSSSSLLKAFSELDFQSYYVKPNNKNDINLEEKSNNSTISLDNFCCIFSEENINEIYKFNTNPILTKKNFMNIRKDRFDFLKDLSNISDIYYREKQDNKFIKLQQYYDLFDLIKTFIDSFNTQTMFLFGPKGVSKTTFFLFLKNLLLDVDIYIY